MGTSSAWVDHGLASLPASSRTAGVGLCNAVETELKYAFRLSYNRIY